MNTFIANLKYAVRNRETVTIGGGEFQPGELASVVNQVEQLQNAAENSARENAAAVAGAKNRPYPTYLARVDQWVGDVLFTCWYDYEPADAGVGFNATAWLMHAHVHGHPADLIDFLRDSVVKDLEEEAACLLSSD